jgi:hypothetical protein
VFTCLDCGIEVHAIGVSAANDQDLCIECTWLRNIEDPAEREKLRQWLKERNAK